MSEIGEYETDERIVNDCDRWVFFGDTMSKGKKNDHIFHNACTTHIINYYDRKSRNQERYYTNEYIVDR